MFFLSSRRRHTRYWRDWSSDVCSSDLAGANGKGPLAEELVRTLQDIAVGQPRREAYLALAERTGVKDLARFIRAVVQADQYGVSIADVLRTQAQEIDRRAHV